MTPRAPHISGPVPEKIIGWLWGFGFGLVVASLIQSLWSLWVWYHV